MIKLNDTIALTEAVKVTGNRTITLEGGSITRGKNKNGSWYTGTLLSVDAGSTLALASAAMLVNIRRKATH